MPISVSRGANTDIVCRVNKHVPTPLGLFLKSERDQRGWTQVQLSEHSGVPQSTISDVERGVNNLPGAAYRRGLARALGVSHERILIEAGELLPEEASRPTEPRRFPAHPGYDAVLDVLDVMSGEEAQALADFGSIVLRVLRSQPVAHTEPERVPALR